LFLFQGIYIWRILPDHGQCLHLRWWLFASQFVSLKCLLSQSEGNKEKLCKFTHQSHHCSVGVTAENSDSFRSHHHSFI
jgi:hypothetical protein